MPKFLVFYVNSDLRWKFTEFDMLKNAKEFYDSRVVWSTRRVFLVKVLEDIRDSPVTAEQSNNGDSSK